MCVCVCVCVCVFRRIEVEWKGGYAHREGIRKGMKHFKGLVRGHCSPALWPYRHYHMPFITKGHNSLTEKRPPIL